MSTFLFLALLLAMTTYSSASYCVCNQGVNDTLLQQDIDYACGTKADCSAILKTGSCYLPNTIKAHCDYAVNNYYQKMNQVTGSCSFSGTATVTTTLTSTVVSGCTYPASPSDVIASPTSNSSSATTPTTSITPTTSTTPTTTNSNSTSFDIGPTGTDSKGCTIDAKTGFKKILTNPIN
ncbi:hypothetical protein V2J09_020020 [Rumex salicifolius]